MIIIGMTENIEQELEDEKINHYNVALLVL
jgi:hypothetical protein